MAEVMGPREGAFLLSEGEGTISRESITLKKRAAVYEPGTLLGQVADSGLYKAFDPAASDGSETACAVLYDRVDASAADTRAVAIVRLAEVDAHHLIGLDADGKAVADLARQHIIVRGQ